MRRGPLRVLVIGKTGQVARALAERAEGDEAIDLTCLGRPDADLRERESLLLAIDDVAPHVVINAGAWTDVDRAESDRETALAVNATGARWLAELTNDFNLPIVHISTECVFSGDLSQPYLESDAVRPVNWYGETKRRGELSVAGFNPKHLIVRTAWVFSPWGRNFLTTMLKLGRTREEIEVVSDQIGQPTYAPDLARALIEMVKTMDGVSGNDPRWGTYHVTGEGFTSRADQAKAVFEESAKLDGPIARVIPVESWQRRTVARRPFNSVLDGSRLYRRFGLRMDHWRNGVREGVARWMETEGGA